MNGEGTDEVTIELMTPEDISEIMGIERRSFDEPWPDDVFRAELRHCWSHCHVLRRKAAGNIIGYLVFWSVGDEVHLLNLAVDPNERHNKYGLLLIDHVRKYARTNGARFITLEVRSSNEAAIELYKTAGFKVVGVRPRFFADNCEDAMVMLFDCDPASGGEAPGPAQGSDLA